MNMRKYKEMMCVPALLGTPFGVIEQGKGKVDCYVCSHCSYVHLNVDMGAAIIMTKLTGDEAKALAAALLNPPDQDTLQLED